MDSENGIDIDSIIGLRDLFDSECSRDLLLEKRKGSYTLKSAKTREIPRLRFAILDAAFGPQSLAMSESGGPVRCVDSLTGIELWRFMPEKDSHFLKLWFRKTDGNFYGVHWNYQQGRFRHLVRLEAGTGEAKTLCELDSWQEEYCAKLDCVVASSGALIDLDQGRLLHRLDFPQKEYSD